MTNTKQKSKFRLSNQLFVRYAFQKELPKEKLKAQKRLNQKVMKIFYKHYIYDSFFGIFQHFSPFPILFAYGFCETIRVYLYTSSQRRIFQHLNNLLTLGKDKGFLPTKIPKTEIKRLQKQRMSRPQKAG